MIYGFVGFIGSGKNTAANFLIEQGVKLDSFAAPLKDAVSAIFGWPRHLMEGDTTESRDFRETPDLFWSRRLGIDNFTPRMGLQLIGTDVMREHFHKDIWLNSLEYRLRSNEGKDVVITDVRFRNELDLIKSIGGAIIWIKKEETPQWFEDAVKANSGNVLSKKIMSTRYRDVHTSEWDWCGYDFDYVVENNGTVDELKEKVLEIYFENRRQLRAV